MIAEGTLTGIGLFTVEVIHLISAGKHENFAEIEKHFENRDLVEYLSTKYAEHFFAQFDGTMYDNAAINQYFFEYTGYIQGNERRKYGIMNDEDGLLLIPALLMDRVETECRKWKQE